MRLGLAFCLCLVNASFIGGQEPEPKVYQVELKLFLKEATGRKLLAAPRVTMVDRQPVCLLVGGETPVLHGTGLDVTVSSREDGNVHVRAKFESTEMEESGNSEGWSHGTIFRVAKTVKLGEPVKFALKKPEAWVVELRVTEVLPKE